MHSTVTAILKRHDWNYFTEKLSVAVMKLNGIMSIKGCQFRYLNESEDCICIANPQTILMMFFILALSVFLEIRRTWGGLSMNLSKRTSKQILNEILQRHFIEAEVVYNVFLRNF